MTTTTPTDAQMKLARKCAAKVYRDADPTDALAGYVEAGEMDDGMVVQSALLAIQATEARAQGLVEALEPLAKLELPQKPSYNAGAYSIFHKDILAARQALATWRRT